MLKKILKNCKSPQSGVLGSLILWGMNLGHRSISKWGFQCFPPQSQLLDVLDIGCGGGYNIKSLSKMCKSANIYGVDYSPVSVKKSIAFNQKEIKSGRVSICEGNVNVLPYSDGQFELVTAFETIYFWQPIEQSLNEVNRVLREKGTFLIVCESSNPENATQWTSRIEGMTVYEVERLRKLLLLASFSKVEIKTDGNRCAVLATK